MIDRAYQIMELQPTASKKEVKQAFHDLLKVWHPDKFGTDSRMRQKAEQKTRDIIWAYETVLFHLAKPKTTNFRQTTVSPGPEIKPHFDPSFMARHAASAQQRGVRATWREQGRPRLGRFASAILTIIKAPFVILEFFLTILIAWRLGVVALAACSLMALQAGILSSTPLVSRIEGLFGAVSHVLDEPARPRYIVPVLPGKPSR